MHKRRFRLLVGVVLLLAVLRILYVWAFSKPHTPLEYMVAGTLATSIALAAAFVQMVRRGRL